MRTTTLRCTGGAIIGFEVDDDVRAELLERAADTIDGVTTGAPSASYRQHHAADGGVSFVRSDGCRESPTERVGADVSDLIDDLHLTVALHATDQVFVHAGAVVWNGAAILLPGRSHVGKSTLVHALVRAGATYLSDEYARITPDGLIRPYPRPIHLRHPAGRRLIDPSTIGAVGADPAPPGLVVFTSYSADAAFSPEPVSPGRAALDLLDNTVVADVDPSRAAAAVAVVSRTAIAVRSLRPEAEPAAASILAFADERMAAA